MTAREEVLAKWGGPEGLIVERIRSAPDFEIIRLRWVDKKTGLETLVELTRDDWMNMIVDVDPDARFE